MGLRFVQQVLSLSLSSHAKLSPPHRSIPQSNMYKDILVPLNHHLPVRRPAAQVWVAARSAPLAPGLALPPAENSS
ncbi:hypothetical protein IWZ01DRAFT_539308 [Phyllosticta capitalensis]